MATTKDTTGSRIIVGCKLPTGVWLHVDRPMEEKGPDGKVFNIRHVQHGDKVYINGVNSSRVIGGYGLTRNVDLSFWEEWWKQNSTGPLVKNNLIFNQSSLEKAEDQAAEQKDVKSKLEPLSQIKPGTNVKKFEE